MQWDQSPLKEKQIPFEQWNTDSVQQLLNNIEKGKRYSIFNKEYDFYEFKKKLLFKCTNEEENFNSPKKSLEKSLIKEVIIKSLEKHSPSGDKHLSEEEKLYRELEKRSLIVQHTNKSRTASLPASPPKKTQ